MKEIFLETSAGQAISVTVFDPENPNGKLLLINSATGVKQQVYFSFAKYFSGQGFTVITYDYSGIGQSKPERLRGFETSMRIWGTRDYKAVTDFIKTHYPGHIKFCLGHSVGALILGMNADSAIFDKFIFVATQEAYIGNLSFGVACTAVMGFGVALPLLTTIFGYFPAHRFGLGESLPKGVAYDWRTLILNKKSTNRLYEKIRGGFSGVLSQPVLIIHAEDDTWVTAKGMKNLVKNTYPNLNEAYREVKINESEKREIGHVNFFRSFNKNLWKIISDAL